MPEIENKLKLRKQQLKYELQALIDNEPVADVTDITDVTDVEDEDRRGRKRKMMEMLDEIPPSTSVVCFWLNFFSLTWKDARSKRTSKKRGPMDLQLLQYWMSYQFRIKKAQDALRPEQRKGGKKKKEITICLLVVE